jgi:uncharacterized protein YecT (DUF1311 family)
MSLVLAASAAQWACVDEARTETAAAQARDSALTHDLVLAGYDSAVVLPAGRYFGAPVVGARTVTESRGELAVPGGAADSAVAPASVRTVSTPAPSADSYIGPSCASPAAEDQKRCLEGYLARSDAGLDRSYQALITQLKAEAGTRASAAEPATVQRLRTIQRKWVDYRDDECRKRTHASEGPLWAPVRAKCLEQYSVLREKEFADALSKRKTVAAKSTPEKPKATKHTRRTTKSKRHRRR